MQTNIAIGHPSDSGDLKSLHNHTCHLPKAVQKSLIYLFPTCWQWKNISSWFKDCIFRAKSIPLSPSMCSRGYIWFLFQDLFVLHHLAQPFDLASTHVNGGSRKFLKGVGVKVCNLSARERGLKTNINFLKKYMFTVTGGGIQNLNPAPSRSATLQYMCFNNTAFFNAKLLF